MNRFTPDELDSWLQRHAGRPAEYPFYTERQLMRREARHPGGATADCEHGLPACVAAYLEESRLADCLNVLGLGPVERAIAEMRAAGCTVREVARLTGLTKWRVEKAMTRIRRRARALGRAERSGAEGWQEVYLADIRRAGR